MSEPASYEDVLATLLALVGREVELVVISDIRPTRRIVSAQGMLRAGPELGEGTDALLPIAVGGFDVALKRSWVDAGWCDPDGPWLALLFEGGVLVEIDPVADIESP